MDCTSGARKVLSKSPSTNFQNYQFHKLQSGMIPGNKKRASHLKFTLAELTSFKFGGVCVNLKTVYRRATWYSVYLDVSPAGPSCVKWNTATFEKSPSKFKTKIFEFSAADVTNKEIRIGTTKYSYLKCRDVIKQNKRPEFSHREGCLCPHSLLYC